MLRDPRNRVALIAPPLLQLFLFSFTGTQDVKNIRLAILNQDSGQPSSELIQRFSASPNFTDVYFVQSREQLRELIDNQGAILAVQVPTDYSERFYANNDPEIQLVLDGRKSAAAQIAQGYVASIVEQYSLDQRQTINSETQMMLVAPRNWYNPNLEYLWFTVPSLE